jgi:hypothetical protein
LNIPSHQQHVLSEEFHVLAPRLHTTNPGSSFNSLAPNAALFARHGQARRMLAAFAVVFSSHLRSHINARPKRSL